MAKPVVEQVRQSAKVPANQPFNLPNASRNKKKKKTRWNGYDTTPKQKNTDE